MKQNIFVRLKELGSDTDSALNRFGNNEILYQKFLLKFLQDDTYTMIGPALAAKDWDKALEAAHTLKGVSGNLGLTSLYDACSNMVSFLRGDEYEKALQSYKDLKNIYEKISAVLSFSE